MLEGEPGIGKTTLWLAGIQQARERGFRVLAAHPNAAESMLAYTSLADMIGGLDVSAFAGLPGPQRLAMDQLLLRADAGHRATDQRAVSAGFLSVVTRLTDESPVLLAIDDLQWLDSSSLRVISFAARRLAGPVGVLATVRTDPDSMSAAARLQLPSPDGLSRVALGPLSLGGLHAALSERLGRSFPRPTMVRIHEVSGGNPFYALELARALDAQPVSAEASLPNSLTELVRARIGGLRGDVQHVLLAAACVPTPTVELLARATDNDAEHVVGLLEDAEGKGIVGIDGHRLRFTHPLLARGVYTEAGPARRRAMHRSLADIVEQPELAARHLALAMTVGDEQTLRSLDTAAVMASRRGAPAAAAELLELAAGLGGDTPQRRILLARHHFDAGDPARARALLEEIIETLAPGVLRAEASSLLAVVHIFEDSPPQAAAVLQAAIGEAGDNLALRVQMLVTLSFALLNTGELTAAVRSVEDAVTDAERLGQPKRLSQALGMRVMVRFLAGDSLDDHSLRRALALETSRVDMPVAFRPRMQNAMLLSWTGQLEHAREEMASIRRRCTERGEESEWMFVAFNSLVNEIWRGKFTEATLVAEDAMERALQMGGDILLSAALTMRATLATYAGRVDEARGDAVEALAASQRAGSSILAGWPITIIGFLEVSLANYQAAATTLEPLLGRLDAAPKATEIFTAWFVPDAAEAMIHLGRYADAEALIDMLEGNGRRLDRAWMLAVGGRCRAMLLAARGDVGAASLAAQQALAEHDRLPMPFERARTQLLLGQVLRRHRQREASQATLCEALSVFEDLKTPLWAERARAELARANVRPTRSADLTPTERRIAELVASGMTNRDVAAEMFISPKTVEANLGRIYGKLDIHSRAELGHRMGRHER